LPVPGVSARKRQLLAALADGEFHSGQQLAARAGISRSAVWKHVRGLTALGLDIEGVTGRGYRLAAPVELLDAAAIRAHLDRAGTAPLQVEVLFETASTNRCLFEQPDGTVHGRAVLAEYQSAGRGRGDNRWLAAPAGGLCLSLGWRYEAAPASLTGLSLAAGVAVAGALQAAGCSGVGLKWPNDVMADNAKLGGILVESRLQGAGPCEIVIGVGVNMHLPEQLARSLDRRVTDLATLQGSALPSRNRLAAAIIAGLASMLERYGREGFAAFISDWRRLDAGCDRDAVLLQGGRQSRGHIAGIDDNGLLIMIVEGERRKFSSGELSLRLLK